MLRRLIDYKEVRTRLTGLVWWLLCGLHCELDITRYLVEQLLTLPSCVASGTNDLANQAAFDMASTHDLPLKRTVGVITKCDVTQDKEQVSPIHMNSVDFDSNMPGTVACPEQVNHGWFVVRNRNPEEIEHNISSAERHDRERAIFDSAPWTELPESRRGVQALKKYLADLLCKRIQDIFPTILETIKDRQTATSSKVLKIGTRTKDHRGEKNIPDSLGPTVLRPCFTGDTRKISQFEEWYPEDPEAYPRG